MDNVADNSLENKTLLDNVIVEMLVNMTPENLSESSTTSSFSDESDHNSPIRRKRSKVMAYIENVVRRYSTEEFKIHFRINRTTAYVVISMFEHSRFLPTHTYGREKITAEKSFLLSLWYLSNNETFRQISDRFDTSYSSAHYCLQRMLKFLHSIKSNIIKWPTGNTVIEINEGFKKKHGIENVLGAIDGSHIEINLPKTHSEVYINRNGYPSLLLQGVVDHKKKFIDVFCGEPGSVHDARLLRKSTLYNLCFTNPDFMGPNFLIGDSAYPNLEWLVTPFRDNGQLTRNQKTFNYRISSTRVVVENAFGLLKGRFRRLRKLDNLDLKLCSRIIMASCILHNICIDKTDFMEANENDFNQPDCTGVVSTVVSNIHNDGKKQLYVYNKMFNNH